ncbi:DNA ligase [Rhodocyclus tenuis]|uniref:DNA ligase n=1 Tax=Rhodocyclus gracilis TaxID=2929842 RepID=UPI001298A3B8|nr:DNA ligase [Rhodocyclus gracilis]MRD73738.1 DNA ligase [Rhodocyclus gracilis]
MPPPMRENLSETLSMALLVSALLTPSVAAATVASVAAEPVPPPVLLAAVYRPSLDPVAYWVSEKLDGVRAFWDGQRLRFRSGRPIAAPAWFVAALPAHPLDGELWIGRGEFDAVSATVRRERPLDDEWRRVQYRLFERPPASDAASTEGGLDFTQRLERLRADVAGAGVPWLSVVEQFRVADHASLSRHLAAVVAAGGEGLVLHRADAPYLTGRSEALLKLKPLRDDEATVVGYVPGKGRWQGAVGALIVERADGCRLRLGSGLSAALRQDPPPRGARVSYRYTELTSSGQPRFARYWRLAEDF